MLAPFLRFVQVFALCGMLSACVTTKNPNTATGDEVWCGPSENGYIGCFHAAKGAPICPNEYNLVQCFFSDAEFQSGGDEKRPRELQRAFKDALELPIEELRKPRYSDYQWNPNQWTFDQLIGKHFVSGALIRGYGYAPHDTDGFYVALKLPESATVLKDWIQRLEESIPKDE